MTPVWQVRVRGYRAADVGIAAGRGHDSEVTERRRASLRGIRVPGSNGTDLPLTRDLVTVAAASHGELSESEPTNYY